MSDSVAFDDAIRPSQWADYVGQEALKGRIKTAIDAAIAGRWRLDDILLLAPPGAGKTTLAKLIADRYHVDMLSFTMPVKPLVFVDAVEELNSGIVFLDEIHAAPARFQELLQPAMEDDRTLYADGFEVDTSDITFVAATTTEFAAKLLDPFVQRFEIQPAWEPYSDAEIALILAGMAQRLGFSLDESVCVGLAGACGATPRLAKRFVKAARDLGATNREVSAEAVLDYVGVDADGLGANHLAYLQLLKDQGRVSQRNLASQMFMSTSAIEDLERPLMRKGFVTITSAGRRITPAGKAKLGGGRKSRAA